MNRLDRLSSILIHLQSKNVIKAQEIADRFEISLRTVYRDIRSLEESGVPIIGEAGYGYSLVEGFRLPPVHFTKEEALSFITAQKLVEKFADPITKSNFESALFKIKAVLKNSDKASFSNLWDTIEVIQNKYLPDLKNEIKEIPAILNAIEIKKPLVISYLSMNDEFSHNREIEPVGIYAQGSYWYLIAFCLRRQDYRNFRVDRIKSLVVSNGTVSKSHPSLANFLDKTSEEKTLVKIVVKVEKHVFKYFGDQHYYHGFIEKIDLGEYFELRFLSNSLRGFAHWFMYFGAYAEILEPLSLKALVLEELEKIKSNLLKTY